MSLPLGPPLNVSSDFKTNLDVSFTVTLDIYQCCTLIICSLKIPKTKNSLRSFQQIFFTALLVLFTL